MSIRINGTHDNIDQRKCWPKVYAAVENYVKQHDPLPGREAGSEIPEITIFNIFKGHTSVAIKYPGSEKAPKNFQGCMSVELGFDPNSEDEK